MPMIRLAYLSMVVFIVSGCAQYGWIHPTKDTNTFYVENNQCNSQAMATYPVSVVKRVLFGAVQAPDTTDCTRFGNMVRCSTTPGQYTPPATFDDDVNQGAREQFFDNCMKGNGWRLVRTDIPAPVSPPSVPAQSVTLGARAGALEDGKAGRVAVGRGDFDEAIRLCTKALDSGQLSIQHQALAHHDRARAYGAKRQFDRAFQDFDQAIKLKPDYTTAYYGRGLSYGSLRQSWQAITDFDQAIKLKPDYAEAFDRRGVSYSNIGQPDRAIQDFDQAIKLKPDLVSGYNSLAWLYATCRDKKYLDGKKAVAAAQRAVELKRFDVTLDTLAASYARNGQFKDAVKAQEEGLAMLKAGKNLPPDKVQNYEERLALYRAGKAYTELEKKP